MIKSVKDKVIHILNNYDIVLFSEQDYWSFANFMNDCNIIWQSGVKFYRYKGYNLTYPCVLKYRDSIISPTRGTKAFVYSSMATDKIPVLDVKKFIYLLYNGLSQMQYM